MISMQTSDWHFMTGADAFALEDKILDDISAGAKRFEMALWQTQTCLVVPRSFTRNPSFEQASEVLSDEGWPVFVRCTGGDVTPQGWGTVNVTLAYRLPEDTQPSIEDQYDLLCQPIAGHLRAHGVAPNFSDVPYSFCDGAHNLSVDGRKMVGTAQRWRRVRDGSGAQVVFSHALILVDADLPAGIAATNRLYAQCGLDQRVRAASHINLRDALPQEASEVLDISEYMRGLHAAYTDLLNTCSAA